MRLEAYSSVSAALEAYTSVSAREGAARDPIGETRVLSPEEEVHSEFTSVAWESTGDTRRLSGTEEAATHALRGTDVRGAGEAVTANRVSRERDSGPVPSEASESQCSLIHQRSSHTGGGGSSTRGAPPPGGPGEPRSDAPAKEGGQAARRGAHLSLSSKVNHPGRRIGDESHMGSVCKRIDETTLSSDTVVRFFGAMLHLAQWCKQPRSETEVLPV